MLLYLRDENRTQKEKTIEMHGTAWTIQDRMARDGLRQSRV